MRAGPNGRRGPIWALLLVALALAPATVAEAHFSSTGSGSASASATTLAAPTVSAATPGLNTVALSWNAVTPPGSGVVSYYVTRDGGAPAGDCPTSAAPSEATSCTDSGVSVGNHSYKVVAVWRTWTAASSAKAAQVVLGPGSHFVMTAAITSPTAGVADNLTITAKDAGESTITGYTGSHNLTFGPVADSPSGAHATVVNASGAAVNFESSTAITFTNGVATVSSAKNGVMKLVNTGPASITVSDGAISNGTGLAVTVGPATAASFSLAAATTTPTAGVADNLTITAKDSFGNTATSYTGSHSPTFGPVADSPSGAHATVSDSSGTAVNFGTATAITFASGVANVSGASNGAMTLVKPGASSITVKEGTITNGTGLAVTVSPATAATLTLAATTTTPLAGAADNLTITAKDSFGNTATAYTGSHNLTFGPVADSPGGAHATVSDSSGAATSFGSATAITFTAGVSTVSGANNGAMKLVKPGAASITVSDGAITNGAGLAVTVRPATAASFTLAAATTTPVAGAADNLTITAKDSFGNTATAYTGSHSLTFGPVSDSPSAAHATVSNASGTAVNFGSATAITFTAGVSTVSAANNGAMKLVRAGPGTVTVKDSTIESAAALTVTVSPGAAARLAWTHATSSGVLSAICLFTCTGTGIGAGGSFEANVSVTDSSGNTVSDLGSGHTASVTAASGTIAGGALAIAEAGPAESTTRFTYVPTKTTAVTLTAATTAGTTYTSATATMTK